jgi:hypothetical protein
VAPYLLAYANRQSFHVGDLAFAWGGDITIFPPEKCGETLHKSRDAEMNGAVRTTIDEVNVNPNI